MEREPRTIVLVDGSTTMLYYHGILLKRLSYATLPAATAEEALSILERTSPSLVLTEVSLPLMSGVEFIRKIRGNDRTRHLPVIVLTREDDPAFRAACLELGCAGYLLKPVDTGMLYRTIQAASEPVPRSCPRLVASLDAVVGGGGTARTERVTAISEAGLFIRTNDPQPRNTVVPLRILFDGREISVSAVVLYTIAPGEGADEEPGMGLKFLELSGDDRTFLKEFIQGGLTGDIEPGAGCE